MKTNEAHHKDQSPPPLLFQDKIILVVDDIRMNYLLIKAMLGKTGAQLIWAEDGFSALEIVSSEPKIDLVLMDYSMPVMDGFETTLKIKELKPEMVVISQSTYTDSPNFDRSSAPFDAYLAKPIIPASLIKVISGFLFK